ncbi:MULTISPECIES: hypothetical protein [Helicobacter]|uniref:PspA/IM30 family protein n=1 Tax=Helicobacter bilis ATCC 43879 TaxID=613026 RepID=C3XHL1_9HELI|nr:MULTISPECIES: hypothetical protein [Helicobacter]EEO24500.1 hypothetical protein HRAG_01557 [Helicobacter bilis ATCC 43879]
MGFWDKAKGFMDSAVDAMESQVRKQAANMSDSQLLDRYNNAESDRVRAILEAEIRKRGLL